MSSIGFPNMFNSNTSVRITSGTAATEQNLYLLLRTEKGSFLSDPYYGIKLKGFLFEQNNYILKDLLIDEIYTQIAIFMPQLKVIRKDIKIINDKEKAKLYCKFKAINQTNFETNMYQLVLHQADEQ